jgi:hypothetical protein
MQEKFQLERMSIVYLVIYSEAKKASKTEGKMVTEYSLH